MAQTRQHLKLLQQVGVSKIVVYMSKCDMVTDTKLLSLVEMEIRQLISEYGFDGENTPIIKGSALKAIEGDEKYVNAIKDLMTALDVWIPAPQQYSTKPFLFSIEDIFTITSSDTVVTGSIERGTIKVGDTVQIVGLDAEILTTEVTRIEISREQKNKATVGDNVSLSLKNITKEQVKRGQVVASPNSIVATTKFDANVYILAEEESGINTDLFDGKEYNFYFRTTNISGIIDLPDDIEIVNLGDDVSFTASLTTNVAMEIGTEFSIKENGRTIGIGTVTKVY